MVDSTTTLTPLTDDIQRALQQAVGDANNAVAFITHPNAKPHKKSKRHREEGQDQGEGNGDRVKKKKKKSKRHSVDEPRDVDVSPSEEASLEQGASANVSATKIRLPASGESTPGAGAARDVDPTHTPPRKKKKNKGKERAQVVSTPELSPMASSQSASQQELHSLIPPGASMDLATSSEDFLSAVVAAASATATPPPQQGAPVFDQYVTYPPDLDPYAFPGPPPNHDQLPPHDQPPFPAPFADGSGMLPDLSSTSSEDLLRCLQDFDISKVITILKTLGEAAAAANVQLNISPMFLSGVGPPAPLPHVQQQPVPSEMILGRPPKQKKGRGVAGGSSASGVEVPVPLQPENPEHAHMLANVWMNATKLAQLVKTEGLVYKKGKFSATEDVQLANAIEQYRVRQGLTPADLDQIIFSHKLGKEKGHESFWSEITAAVPLRPIIAVYHHVRRTRHPFAGKGTWTKTEDDLLLHSVQQLGQQWEKISDNVQRTASDCRDRYRNHLQDRNVRHTGAWTKEEEDELTRIVTDMTLNQGKDMDNDIFWGIVSQKMDGKRGRQQCRIKWTDSLAPQIKNTGERPRWSAMDAYILVHKVDSMNVRDDTEIDWKLLPDENWNVWSAHSLQRRWLTMKRGVKGFEDMSHAEIMEILKTKKAQSPPPSSSARKKKNKYLSAEAVNDTDDSEMQSGPSTGPDTIAGNM